MNTLPEFVTRFARVENDRVVLPQFDAELNRFVPDVDAKHVCSIGGFAYGLLSNRYKEFTKRYGSTPRKVAQWVNGAQRQAWFHGDLTVRLAYKHGSKKFDQFWVMKTHAHVHLLEQARRDGLDHLMPVIAYHGQNPHELRAFYGKGLWRKLCNNSFSRNKLLMDSHHLVWDWPAVPTTILKSVANKSTQSALLLQVAVNLTKHYKDVDTWFMGQDKFIVWDTIGMAEDLGRSVNSKWTMQRWRAEHDFLVKEINARRYSSDQIVKDHAVCLAGKVAVRLVSAREIADEGSRMRHCVASYIPHVRRGEYLVYSIRDSIDGPSLATLGLRAQCYPLILGEPAPAARWHLDQMYGPCNSEVDFPFDVQKLVSLLEPPTPVYKYVEAAGDFDLPL